MSSTLEEAPIITEKDYAVFHDATVQDILSLKVLPDLHTSHFFEEPQYDLHC